MSHPYIHTYIPSSRGGSSSSNTFPVESNFSAPTPETPGVGTNIPPAKFPPPTVDDGFRYGLFP